MQDSSKLSEAVEPRFPYARHLTNSQVPPVQIGERWIRSEEEGNPVQGGNKWLEWKSAAESTKLDSISEAIDQNEQTVPS